MTQETAAGAVKIARSIFKAYDIRGKYPDELSEDAALLIASRLIEKTGAEKVVIGYDARKVAPLFYEKLKTGCGAKEIIPGGMMTTPMLYFLVNHFGADLGIMITASHNPPEYIGLKAVKKGAEPVSGDEIYALISG